MSDTLAQPSTLKFNDVDPVELATILPLDYTTARSEHSIIYFSRNWEDLVKLLENPFSYMREVQEGWKQTGEKHFCWRLHPPVTIILQPGEPSAEVKESFSPNFATIRPNMQVNNIFTEQIAMKNSIGVEAIRDDHGPKLQEIIDRAKDNGLFLAEFAVDTAVMMVWYWPPKEPRLRTLRNEKKFTRGVVGLVPGIRTTGTLHIDMGAEGEARPTSLDRAHLVVDLLESRDWFVSLMNTGTTFEMGDMQMHPKDSDISPDDKPKRSGGFKEVVGRDLGHDQKHRPTIIVERLSPFHDPMRLEMEQMNAARRAAEGQSGREGGSTATSEDIPEGTCSAVCCNIYLHDNDDGKLMYMNGVLIKCYDSVKPRPCPPLEEVQDRADAARIAERNQGVVGSGAGS